MNDEENRIAFLNNYVIQLKKIQLGVKGREMVRTIEKILRREVKLQSELKELRSKHDSIKSMGRSKPLLFSQEPKVTDKRYVIEELNKNRNRSINGLLEAATNLIIRSERR